MKKVGCITFHASHNYGSNLQAYALQEVITKYNKCKYEIINFRTKRQINEYDLYYRKKGFKNFIKKLLYFKYNKMLITKYNKHELFINNKLKLSKKVFTSLDSLKNNKFDYDCCISGSDQIWNIKPIDFDWAYYLEFISNCKKISYASSFGPIKQEWSNEDYLRIKNDLKQYDSISVREQGSYDNVKKITNINPEINVDPTMLLSAEEWDKIVDKNKFQQGDYIFLYDLKNNKETYKLVNKISKKLKLKVVVCKEGKYTIFSNYIKRFDAGPEDFLNLIKHAKLILSTSFHGNVFSIIYNKPFFAINGNKDFRINTLLNKMKLDNRSINDKDYIEKLKIAFNIDFCEANIQLKKEKEKSIKYLMNSINN